MPLRIGYSVTVRRAISDAEVRDFARLTGDFSANHVDEEVMRNSPFGKRMVHGALLVGLMSAASTELLAGVGNAREAGTPVSAGFDKVRFLAPVAIDEPLTVIYQIEQVDAVRKEAKAKAVIVGTKDRTIKAVGYNMLKWIAQETPGQLSDVEDRPAPRDVSPASALEVLQHLLQRRQSVRAYLPNPLPANVIEKMLRTAQQVPSGCNAQPWQVALVSGERLKEFREGLVKFAATGQASADIGWPREYRGVYKQRRRNAAWALYNNVGVKMGDRAGSATQTTLNYRFFDAPHVAIITNDEAIGTYGVLDCGIYICGLLLAAEALNVSAVPQGAPAEFSNFIRQFLGLPDDRQVVCAIAFGYADQLHPANRTRTERAELDEVVTWC
jgi:nitroreductase/acyl dehydratase